jgi:hypothetical protein
LIDVEAKNILKFTILGYLCNLIKILTAEVA